MIPDRIALDTSVLAAAALGYEPKHPTARTLMRTLDQDQVELVVPSLLIPEFMSALQRQKYPLARIRQLMLAYRSSRLTVVPVDLALADKAGDIALLQGTKGADSVYLALARTLGIPLITLDREQLERAPSDIEVFTPEDALAKWWPD